MVLTRLSVVAAALLLVAAPAGARAARVLDGLAIVQYDGSLRIAGENVYLWGTYLPLLDRFCTPFERPPRCAPTPVLVLGNLVGGFVRCEVVEEGHDAVQGLCTQAGRDLFGPREDIAATMISRGWAL